MFGKLLKHDFKAILKNALPLSLSALVASIVGGLSISIMTRVDLKSDILAIIFTLATILSYLVVISAPIGILILIYMHFYKNLFTDEGYLTFTLPVKRSSILLSKTVNAMIWTATSVVLTFVLIIISMLSAGEFSWVGNIFKTIFSLFKFSSFVEAVWLILYAIVLILIAVAFTALQINLIQFCITCGSTIVKKHKILAAIGIYYATNYVLSTAATILVMLSSKPIAKLFAAISIADPNLYLAVILLILIIVFAVIAAVAFALYSMSLRRIKYKLNIS